jgi:hypothetical protein
MKYSSSLTYFPPPDEEIFEDESFLKIVYTQKNSLKEIFFSFSLSFLVNIKILFSF